MNPGVGRGGLVRQRRIDFEMKESTMPDQVFRQIDGFQGKIIGRDNFSRGQRNIDTHNTTNHGRNSDILNLDRK